ncbi:hypothetical protein CDAR_577721 [Caerostris darwini]|uniref:Ribosomal protein L2 n=1 Tax=Caerostris darwini TaxID=1538125 RepID=A0AAV4RHP6_9ARAC|nr:hypothetical protein CDAR_577721 [Caerostris darwini]
MRDGRSGNYSFSSFSRTWKRGTQCNPGLACLKSTNARFDKDGPTGRILNGVASNVKATRIVPPRKISTKNGTHRKIAFCIMSRPGSLTGFAWSSLKRALIGQEAFSPERCVEDSN